ncbi:hypothetical protein [Lacipirellula limnantheis]|uniref:Uncharacterized protein n=1 Tax=Lacipirellula limnantheis TaxID=2528024 RepID=A0A517TYI3_9BACT|nr:hypothetical protein [Lacipirellula limnantheis]QDT73429.1 hypothetical protein I41_26180 [Lacipirellula limnantheis]
MTNETKCLRAAAVALLTFSVWLLTVGIYQWFTTGNFVPLGPGALLFSSTAYMTTAAWKRK